MDERNKSATVPFEGTRTQSPLFTFRQKTTTEMEPVLVRSRLTNGSNLVNWLDAAQEFHRKLSDADWRALSIVGLGIELGRMPKNADAVVFSRSWDDENSWGWRNGAHFKGLIQSGNCETFNRAGVMQLRTGVEPAKDRARAVRPSTQNPMESLAAESEKEGKNKRKKKRENEDQPCRIKDHVYPAADLEGKTIEQIASRAVEILARAPKLQDDLIGFVAVPRNQIAQSTSRFQKDLQFRFIGPNPTTSFLVIDTDPMRALQRVNRIRAFQVAGGYTPFVPSEEGDDEDGSEEESDDEDEGAENVPETADERALRLHEAIAQIQSVMSKTKQNQSLLPAASNAGERKAGVDQKESTSNLPQAQRPNPQQAPLVQAMRSQGTFALAPTVKPPEIEYVVVRVQIRRGSPALPILLPNNLIFDVSMPIVLPPGARWFASSTRAFASEKQRAVGAMSLTIDVPIQVSGEGKIAWPPLPVVVPQPPVETFVDLPLDLSIGPTTTTFCLPSGWLAILDSIVSAYKINPDFCYERQTWPAAVRDAELWRQNHLNLEVQAKIMQDPAAGLILLNPKDEPLLSAAAKSALFWYRISTAPIPPSVRIVTRPCNKRFIILPLVIVAIDSKADRAFSHKNYLIFDRFTKLVERYEPHGAAVASKDLDYADVEIPRVLARIAPDFRYEPPSASCPVLPGRFLGAQAVASEGSVGAYGYCECWSNAYLTLRLLNPTWLPQQIKIQMNRAGAANVVTDLPPIANSVFPPPLTQYANYEDLFSVVVTRPKLGLMLVEYIQLYNAWTMNVRRSAQEQLDRADREAKERERVHRLLAPLSRVMPVARPNPVPAPARPTVPQATAKPPGYGGSARMAGSRLGYVSYILDSFF